MARKRKLVSFILILLLFLMIMMKEQIRAQAATIRISSSSITMEANHYKTLYIYGTSKKVSWTSSNKSIATVNTSGKVYSKAPGTATIYATVSGKKLACKVTVIKLNSSSVAMGKSITLKVSGTSSKVTWSTSNKNIATISTTGKVTPKAPGKVTIYASVAGKKLSCTVTVVKLSSSSTSLAIGQSITLKVSGTTSKVSWITSNSKVAVVSANGVVTGKSAGTATITGTVLGVKLSSSITVKSPVTALVGTPTPVPTLKPVTTATPTKAPALVLSPTTAPTKVPTITPIPTLSNKIIGYYAAWSRYSGFTPDKLDANKLTHINYAFADIGSDLKIKLGYPDIDAANINGLNQLKKINPNLRTIISVGGYSWSGRFSDVALTEQSRLNFANSCVDFMAYYGFDGIDIDWEYPVSGGLSSNSRRPEDKHDFTLLMKTLRERLNTRGIITGKHYDLSFAGAAGAWYLNNIEVTQINPYVDFVNIMTYDLHGTWESKTNFNAPLFSDDPAKPYNISVDKSIKEWLQTGIPKSKLVMGVPFYGYIYQSVPNVNNGFMQTYSGGASITYQKVISNYLNAPGYQYYYNNNAKVPWLFNGSTFITFDNELSMGEKAQYIKNNELGGVMIWELSQDPNRQLLNSLYQKLK